MAAQPAQLLRSMDDSAFTGRHTGMYATIIAGHLFDGFDINMMGFILPAIVGAFKLNPAQAGFLASGVFLGMLVGSVVIGMLSDRIGRKAALLLAIGIYSALSFLAAFAWDYNSLVWLRILQGVGLGAEVPMVFTYLAEFMPAKYRGRLLASSVFFWQAASMLAAGIAIVLVPVFSWRAMFIAGAVPAVILFIIWSAIPESVRYLLDRGRIDEAERIVRRISTVSPDSVPAGSGALPARPRSSLLDILSGGYLVRTLGIWIMQFTGGFVFIGLAIWLPSIFVKMGFGFVRSLLFTGIITGAGAFGNLGGGWLLDRIGRRSTLALFYALGGALLFAWGTARSPAMILTVGALTAFFGFGGAGGPLFAYTSEVYPTATRGTGTGWAAGWQRIAGIVAPSVLGVLLARHVSNYVFFALMGVLLFVGAIAALAMGFETKDKGLEQIQAELTRK